MPDSAWLQRHDLRDLRRGPQAWDRTQIQQQCAGAKERRGWRINVFPFALRPQSCHQRLQTLWCACSSPGPRSRSQTRCSWTTSGWLWRARPSSRQRFPQTFPSRGWTPPSSPPSSLHWWGAPLLSTQRRTKSCRRALSLQVNLPYKLPFEAQEEIFHYISGMAKTPQLLRSLDSLHLTWATAL